MTGARISSFLRRDTSGAALVEFGMIAPVLLLFVAVAIDGGRLAWIYQSAANGVRDASRMVARIAPPDMCITGGSVAGFDAMVTTIVTQSISGNSVIPTGARVTDVIPSVRCVSGGYRVDPAPIIEIRAQIEIDYLLGGMFRMFGGAVADTLRTEVADQSRVFGT